jgi:hypothetical protein
LAIEIDLGIDAAAIPGAGTAEYSAQKWFDAGPARLVLGWICTASAGTLPRFYSISGIVETPFVCPSPRSACHLEYS